MIRRISEYVIRCDAPDCMESIAYGVHTREACKAEAIKHGWQPCSRNRWLCPHCKTMAERKAVASAKS